MGSKTQIGHVSCKTVLLWKKVCCKVYLCENCQRQSCKAFTGLSIRAQMVGWGCSHLKFSTKVTHPVQIRRYPPYDLTLRRPSYLRLVYHIHSTPVCHMCQCNTYFLAHTSNSREKLLYSLSIYSLSPMRLQTSFSPQPITKWAPWALTNQMSDSQTYT